MRCSKAAAHCALAGSTSMSRASSAPVTLPVAGSTTDRKKSASASAALPRSGLAKWYAPGTAMPARSISDQLRANVGSTNPTPSVAFVSANARPEFLTASQSGLPWNTEVSMPSSATAELLERLLRGTHPLVVEPAPDVAGLPDVGCLAADRARGHRVRAPHVGSPIELALPDVGLLHLGHGCLLWTGSRSKGQMINGCTTVRSGRAGWQLCLNWSGGPKRQGPDRGAVPRRLQAEDPAVRAVRGHRVHRPARPARRASIPPLLGAAGRLLPAHRGPGGGGQAGAGGGDHAPRAPGAAPHVRRGR